ncbi:MAG: hypothetical protein HY744_25035 [Deltaproteobacteria bacterium]|nr:hypothetical protein [Deltaproteobacteria bacterium]
MTARLGLKALLVAAVALAASCHVVAGLEGLDFQGPAAGGTGGAASGCPAGLTGCGGQCVDTDIDPSHCGACGQACAEDQVCSAGTCGLGCLGGATRCGDRCVDAQLDPANCGGSKCVDTQVDAANCGGCGKACGQGEACVQGACKVACAEGKTNCGGKCVDLQADPANCGGCGKACGQGQLCCAGSCTGGVVAVAAGNAHTCAVKAGGTLWCWGWNEYGELGDGTKQNKSSPVQVTALGGCQ